ncbi:spermine oxidase-like [Paramacrobiotus metropolitanus]|uniref:spermine oxidase-like n=1 Tax=Paramacrobiotus metropolitanus TaxID=2943436 RepID=UPI002445B7E3|nr:spermine oxidase-like [Paramacrobiotus metropolitanus]
MAALDLARKTNALPVLIGFLEYQVYLSRKRCMYDDEAVVAFDCEFREEAEIEKFDLSDTSRRDCTADGYFSADSRRTSGSQVLQPKLSAATNGVKVVVIGAGSAGLSAAQDLIKAGFDVTLLEASSRYGGRLWSIPSETGKGWLEMGGQWVHGDGHALYNFCQANNLLADNSRRRRKRSADDDMFTLMNADGTRVTDMRTRLKIYTALDDTVWDDDEYDTLEAQRDLSFGQHLLNSYQKVLKTVTADKVALADQVFDVYVRNQKEEYAAANFFDISVQSATNMTLDGPDATDLRVPYTDVLKLWAPNAVAVAQYNATVKQVRFDRTAARAMTVVLSNGTQINADHVIMTASIGYLKAHVDTLFSPALSERKRTAIQSAGFGTLGKIHLIYDNEWWADLMPDYWTYMYSSGNNVNADRNKTYPGALWTRAIASGLVAPTTDRTLVILMGGPQAVQMEQMSDADVSSAITSLFRQSTGKNVPEPKKILRGKWSQNDLFLGTYSHISMDMVKKGITTADLASSDYFYGKSVNGQNVQVPGLQFAGEATHPKYWSMVHGALSGQREAKLLKQIYSK